MDDNFKELIKNMLHECLEVEVVFDGSVIEVEIYFDGDKVTGDRGINYSDGR